MVPEEVKAERRNANNYVINAYNASKDDFFYDPNQKGRDRVKYLLDLISSMRERAENTIDQEGHMTGAMSPVTRYVCTGLIKGMQERAEIDCVSMGVVFEQEILKQAAEDGVHPTANLQLLFRAGNQIGVIWSNDLWRELTQYDHSERMNKVINSEYFHYRECVVPQQRRLAERHSAASDVVAAYERGELVMKR